MRSAPAGQLGREAPVALRIKSYSLARQCSVGGFSTSHMRIAPYAIPKKSFATSPENPTIRNLCCAKAIQKRSAAGRGRKRGHLDLSAFALSHRLSIKTTTFSDLHPRHGQTANHRAQSARSTCRHRVIQPASQSLAPNQGFIWIGINPRSHLASTRSDEFFIAPQLDVRYNFGFRSLISQTLRSNSAQRGRIEGDFPLVQGDPGAIGGRKRGDLGGAWGALFGSRI